MDRPNSFRQVDAVVAADDIARLSCADALSRREKPVALFTPALLVAHGGFDRDPVIEFDARFPAASKDMRPFYVDLQRDDEFFFRGLGVTPLAGRATPVAWDKRLYCIAEERAEECFEFIGGIAFSDPRTGMFANVFSYDITTLDPTSRRGQMLTVKVFGVASNLFMSFLEERPNKPPRAKKIPMTSAQQTADFLRAHKIVSQFDGSDPLKMRD
jgi:hypothetical protein